MHGRLLGLTLSSPLVADRASTYALFPKFLGNSHKVLQGKDLRRFDPRRAALTPYIPTTYNYSHKLRDNSGITNERA